MPNSCAMCAAHARATHSRTHGTLWTCGLGTDWAVSGPPAQRRRCPRSALSSGPDASLPAICEGTTLKSTTRHARWRPIHRSYHAMSMSMSMYVHGPTCHASLHHWTQAPKPSLQVHTGVHELTRSARHGAHTLRVQEATVCARARRLDRLTALGYAQRHHMADRERSSLHTCTALTLDESISHVFTSA